MPASALAAVAPRVAIGASSSSSSSGSNAPRRRLGARAALRADALVRVSRSRLVRPRARFLAPPRAVAATDARSPPQASQAEYDALWAWLASEGVDVSAASPAPVDLSPGGRGWGLVAARDVGGGEAFLSVPSSLWMTRDTALASPIGPFCEDEAPWVALALQLLRERSVGARSRWAPYVATLPPREALNAPLFWTARELEDLAGSQLLANAAGYDAYVRGVYASLRESKLPAALAAGACGSEASASSDGSATLESVGFGEDDFLWAFGILRSRALPPLDQGESIALVPGLDLANHSGLSSQTWTLNDGGFGSVFGGGSSGPSVLLRAEPGRKGGCAKGAELVCNYGPAKIDSQFALDYGFADAFCSRPGYVLGPVPVPESDVNAFDKEDVLETAGMLAAPAFTIRAFEDPPPELRVFARLLNLKNEDAFLLEAIFRQEAWALISEPVSKENESDACGTMIAGCEEALAGYVTRVEDDRRVAEDAGATPRARLAATVRMGEKQALEEALGYFVAVEGRLDSMEYYQERRLRSLNLLDKDGNSTYDPFQDTMA